MQCQFVQMNSEHSWGWDIVSNSFIDPIKACLCRLLVNIGAAGGW